VTPEQFRQVGDLYHRALELSAAERGAFLDEACGGDGSLRDEVVSLLDAHERAGSFMSVPAIGLAARRAPAEPTRRLTAGSHLGPYEILSLIGSGGMGEVYRARDTRLDRTVAIKILTAFVDDDSAHRRRFEREARLVSSLSHPNVCVLYDVGEQDGVPFLIMEYLEGETLADRLRRGPLPLEEAMPYALQIADALDHAHRQGVVHRDLKPSNIILAQSGAKLLDFGVARPAPRAVIADHRPESDRTALTAAGTIVGTLQYMAPEQLHGEDTDARTDIFGFGAVLYEMVSGQPAFRGKSQASVIAAILEDRSVSLSSVQPDAPPMLDQLVARCLARNPDDRWPTAADLREALRGIGGDNLPGNVPSPKTAIVDRRRSGWIAAAVVLAIAGTLTAIWGLSARTGTTDTLAADYRFEVTPPDGTVFTGSPASFTLSPDGRSVAFITPGAEGTTLWVQPLNGNPRALTSGSVTQPSWSADSRSLAFASGTELTTIDVATGIRHVRTNIAANQSAAWNSDGTIVFKRRVEAAREERGPGSGGNLYSVGAAGPPTPVTTLDKTRGETGHDWPQFLPDGRRFLYMARSNTPEHDSVAYVGSLDSSEPIRLFNTDSHVTYASPGYLIYIRGNTLLAQAFDADRQRVVGAPVPIDEQVERGVDSRRGAFSASRSGAVLVYRQIPETQLKWFDRRGAPLGTLGRPGHYNSPSLSPDGRRVAVARLDQRTGTPDVWLIEPATGNEVRLTDDPSADDAPLWSHDGTSVLFKRGRSVPSTPQRGGSRSFYRKRLSGTEPEQLVLGGLTVMATPYGWARDGTVLVYADGVFGSPSASSMESFDLWASPVHRESNPVPVVTDPRNQLDAALSRDGRWLAYSSSESDEFRVYVREFATGEHRRVVSTGFGREPAWRADGRELYYLAADGHLMAVPIATSPALDVGTPTPLFNTELTGSIWPSYERNRYAVSADGDRFLVNKPARGQSPTVLTVVVNWTAKLRQ
jgi:serine/threonine protein kinase